MTPTTPAPGEIWSLTPPADQPAPLVLLVSRTDPTWRAHPIHDCGALAANGDIRLEPGLAAPFGDAWCACDHTLEVEPQRLWRRLEALDDATLTRIAAARTSGVGDSPIRTIPWLNDPRISHRAAVLGLPSDPPARSTPAPITSARPPRVWRALGGLALAAWLCLLGLWWLKRSPPQPGPPQPGRAAAIIKGGALTGPTWHVVQDGVRQPIDDTPLRPGDHLQLEHRCALGHLLVLQGSGPDDLRPLYPPDGRSWQVDPDRSLVPADLVLDADAAPETFHLICSRRPLDVAGARALFGAPASADAWINTKELRKEP